ncbi:DUF4231 domain-containing protein [Mariniflexile sp. AS56]|uniref:DUF4231 domain-containing protein n=1 Tax=Mariniflexile sp. AS56 TaxID=3063957 RepID=UPI0026F276A4|nr:DUF4231 domain-containing protein [Mariniflexile sp. AS56]MDO7171090.1 DUF4231 domain-containing protein [Mariniflexile sp. AS56]
MNEEQYISERVDDQINWYGHKSKINKNYYLQTQILVIVFSASIPFLVGQIQSDSELISIITGLLGIFITILTSINTLFLFKEAVSHKLCKF